MNRESAVTEELSYQVENCRVCGAEVGLDTRIPNGEMVEPGYAVVIGEGNLSISDEQEGNWSKELSFAGPKDDSSPPDVQGYILCENCAEAVHDHSIESENYSGVIPNSLTTSTATTDLPISGRNLAVIVLVIFLFITILII